MTVLLVSDPVFQAGSEFFAEGQRKSNYFLIFSAKTIDKREKCGNIITVSTRDARVLNEGAVKKTDSLSERKKIILAAVIRSFIKNGEPVGSKALLELTGLNVSSATLRNELSELCELGYLEQPHTSAGRQPTSSGYGLYFDELMHRREVPQDLRTIIDKMLYDAAKDPEHLASVAGELLSDMIGFPAIMATVTKDETYVRRVEILPMGQRTVLILLITSDGVARSRICRSAFNFAPSVLSAFDRIASADIIGSNVNRFTPAFLQTLVAKSGDLSLFLTPLFSSVFEMVEDIASKSISIKGQSNLMKCYSDKDDARRMLSLLTKQELIFSLLANTKENIEVVFGDRTGIEELKPSNIVVAKYSLGDDDVGRIGVVGPTRMAYEQIIPSVEYFARRLGAVMTQAIKDLDE